MVLVGKETADPHQLGATLILGGCECVSVGGCECVSVGGCECVSV